jgi:tyrosyl-tRNA synthetase
MGRALQKSFSQDQQIAMFMPILEGLDGIEKMSKSLGNYIGVSEPSEVMFKKVMEIPDGLIIKYFELTTDEHPDQIEKIKIELESGTNPRNIKYKLAKIVTALYHTSEDVEKAIEYYDAAFRKKDIPDEVPELLIEKQDAAVKDSISELIQMGFVKSKSEFIRLVNQGGVQLNREKVTLEDLNKIIANDDVIKVGKKHFVKFKK